MSSDIVCFILFLCLLPCLAVAQIGGRITVGKSLTAGENSLPWLSPEEHFAFGFHKLDGKNLYLPAIWYNKIPYPTIVWYAKEKKEDSIPVPVLSPAKSQLTLNASGLVLTDPQGVEKWRSGVITGQDIHGFMNDTGNFVVADSSNGVFWQSFDHPTDTLLPTQIMKKGGILSAKLSETNFSQGKFQFRLTQNGNAVLNSNNLQTGVAYDAYFGTNTVNTTDVSNAGEKVVFNDSGYLYVLSVNNKTKVLTPDEGIKEFPATKYYHRATLNFDGVFTLYYYPKDDSTTSGKWSALRSMPDDICSEVFGKDNIGTGPCSYNSICTLGTDKRPACGCPEGFSLLDPNDAYGGCKPDFPTQSCDEEVSISSGDYEFVEQPNVNWPKTDYELYQSYSIEQCKEACLQDCFCNVITYGRRGCWKKRLPLINGKQDYSARTFFKVRRRKPQRVKKSQNLNLVVSVLLGGSVFFNFTLIGLVAFCFLFFYNKKVTVSHQVERAAETNLPHFSFKELVEATDGFKEELGRGAFGIVYKGDIEMGSSVFPIAVKKLDRIAAESENEFQTEVNVIGKTHHKNLVRLLGFCNEGEERLLVYEFLSNGPLASFLYGDTKLSWNQRTQIEIGIAKGLLYLHEECSTQTIHCDIKPQNILLDDYHDAKIADFGLAKLLSLDQSQTYTAIRGTKGYVAPEWFRNCPVTAKVDVYSFGVLLLEIICSRRCIDVKVDEQKAILADWAFDCFQQGALNVLVENDEEAANDIKRVERLVMVAIWCIQEDPSLRPTMKKVTLMLEGIIQVPIPPCPLPSSNSLFVAS